MVVAVPTPPSIPPSLKIVLALLALAGSITGAAIYVYEMKTDVADIKEQSSQILKKVEPIEPERSVTPNGATATPDRQGTVSQTSVEGHVVLLKAVSGETSCGVQVAKDTEYAAPYALECGTTVRVLNFATEKSAVFRIMDKAGSSENWKAIKLALSPAAAAQLEISGRAAIRYTVESVPSATHP